MFKVIILTAALVLSSCSSEKVSKIFEGQNNIILKDESGRMYIVTLHIGDTCLIEEYKR
jgi:hypothetical protein